jgi:hypothetical protein
MYTNEKTTKKIKRYKLPVEIAQLQTSHVRCIYKLNINPFSVLLFVITVMISKHNNQTIQQI